MMIWMIVVPKRSKSSLSHNAFEKLMLLSVISATSGMSKKQSLFWLEEPFDPLTSKISSKTAFLSAHTGNICTVYEKPFAVSFFDSRIF